VLRHYPLNVRRAGVQQGFLKSAVTSDVNRKYRAVELQVDSIQSQTSGAALPVASLPAPFASFIASAAGANAGATPAHLVPKAGVLVVWCDAGLITHLSASKQEGPAVELTGARVRVATEGATLLARSVDVLNEAAQNKAKAASLDSQPNLFQQAQGKFNPPAKAAAPAGGKKKDDDDWDD
jgi:hypothetical protein